MKKLLLIIRVGLLRWCNWNRAFLFCITRQETWVAQHTSWWKAITTWQPRWGNFVCQWRQYICIGCQWCLPSEAQGDRVMIMISVAYHGWMGLEIYRTKDRWYMEACDCNGKYYYVMYRLIKVTEFSGCWNQTTDYYQPNQAVSQIWFSISVVALTFLAFVSCFLIPQRESRLFFFNSLGQSCTLAALLGFIVQAWWCSDVTEYVNKIMSWTKIYFRIEKWCWTKCWK